VLSNEISCPTHINVKAGIPVRLLVFVLTGVLWFLWIQ
jgi:hypothetical protein